MNKPRYQTIKDHLRRQIESDELEAGDRIESENELARRFDVSRLTVQRAVRDLVSEGLLRRVQGAGTFVMPRKKQFSLLEVRDLAEESRARGKEATTEVLLQRRMRPPADVLGLLELPESSTVYHVSVLQKADDEPVAIEERYLRCEAYTDFLEQDFTSGGSVYDYLARRSDLEDVETSLRAIIPEPAQARLLELDPGEPALFLERRNWYRNRVVTLSRFIYAGAGMALSSRYRP